MVRGREQEGAEYSAAVSRLADSVCSCSECAMRGRQETAVKEQKKKKKKEKEQRKREQVHVWEKCDRRVRRFVGSCVRALASVRSFPSPFGNRVERLASEENSILSCSYAVVNHRGGMSHQLILCTSGFSSPSASRTIFSEGLTTFPRLPLERHS